MINIIFFTGDWKFDWNLRNVFNLLLLFYDTWGEQILISSLISLISERKTNSESGGDKHLHHALSDRSRCKERTGRPTNGQCDSSCEQSEAEQTLQGSRIRLDWLFQSHKDDSGMIWTVGVHLGTQSSFVIGCCLPALASLSVRDRPSSVNTEKLPEGDSTRKINEDQSVVSAFKQLTVWWGKWTNKPFSRGGRLSTC